MRLFLKFMLFVCAVSLLACAPQRGGNYIPSISALEKNDTLIMKLKACHWGCTEGTVNFRGKEAINGLHRIKLTAEEIKNLDRYFSNGTKDAAYERCSLPIEISFKQMNGFLFTHTKQTEVYSCLPFGGSDISPLKLVQHLQETPDEIPFWRLSSELQAEKLKIDLAEN